MEALVLRLSSGRDGWLRTLVLVTFALLASGTEACEVQYTASTDVEYSYHYYPSPVNVGRVEFKVKARNDVHISLSNTSSDQPAMYEMVLGGWSNTKSVIRRCSQCPAMEEVSTPNLLDANEFRGFWITYYRDTGRLDVGRAGESDAFMSWTDPSPLDVKYLGYYTGWGSTGEFQFCDLWMPCRMGQEPDPGAHGRYRWVIPVPDPCRCTEVSLGPLNAVAPCRPFDVTYYDTFFQSNDTQEIRRLLKCPDPCVSAPCQNGGDCVELPGHSPAYDCSCLHPFTGSNCEINDFCLVDMCENGGTCALTRAPMTETDMYMYMYPPYNCTCPPQYAGAHCEIRINETCHSNPCLNGGNCTVTEDGYGYNCSCSSEFYGPQCGTYDPCHNNLCQNEGTCTSVGEGLGYQCICQPGYIGVLCKDTDPCLPSPCYGHGNCSVSRDGSTYTCACQAGFVGEECQFEDPCTSDICRANDPKTVCRPTATGNFTCECPQGMTGGDCTENLDPCLSEPCQNSGSCISATDGQTPFTCNCSRYFSGEYCESHASCRAYAQEGHTHYNGWYQVSTKCRRERPVSVLCQQSEFSGGWMKLYRTDHWGTCMGVLQPWSSVRIGCDDKMPVTGFALSDRHGLSMYPAEGWLLDESLCSSLSVRINVMTELANCRQPSTSTVLQDGPNTLLEGKCTLPNTDCDKDEDNNADVTVFFHFRYYRTMLLFKRYDFGTFTLACKKRSSESGYETLFNWAPSDTSVRSMWIKN